MGGGETVTLDATVVSPDGSYAAAVTTEMAGGAAGTCSSSVYVFPKGTAFDADTDQEPYRVAWLHCGPVKLVWAASKKLRIEAIGSEGGLHLFTARDRSGEVGVSYVIGENTESSANGF